MPSQVTSLTQDLKQNVKTATPCQEQGYEWAPDTNTWIAMLSAANSRLGSAERISKSAPCRNDLELFKLILRTPKGQTIEGSNALYSHWVRKNYFLAADQDNSTKLYWKGTAKEGGALEQLPTEDWYGFLRIAILELNSYLAKGNKIPGRDQLFDFIKGVLKKRGPKKELVAAFVAASKKIQNGENEPCVPQDLAMGYGAE
ncbi:hypothetical protein M501DRAFT_1018294 [Patellaria atrata CBS 101060]|uniref:Uncharacterized protein n=1 Tax=Patellaria atrata CBS 101060 TaxID=1346257 RepID=A0A9P4S664_9PEZI|nr:hypothetical protein M501DRAFT_1018294 [Patellaria atrata CBS 101060]